MYRKETFILATVVFILSLFFFSGWERGGNGSWAQTPKEDSSAISPAKNRVGKPPAGISSKETAPA